MLILYLIDLLIRIVLFSFILLKYFWPLELLRFPLVDSMDSSTPTFLFTSVASNDSLWLPAGFHLLREVSSFSRLSVSCCCSTSLAVYLRMLLSNSGTLVQCCMGEISKSVSCSRWHRTSFSHHFRNKYMK